MKILTWVIASVVVGIIAFVAVDCGCGNSIVFDGCRVVDRQFKPAWSETSITTDSHGGFHVKTTDHPEEYHLFCQQVESGESFDVSTAATIYHTITNSQIVMVSVRKGRFTGARYLPTIQP